MIKAVLTGGEKMEVHVCGWVQTERMMKTGDKIMLFYLPPSFNLSFLFCLFPSISPYEYTCHDFSKACVLPAMAQNLQQGQRQLKML